MRSADASLRAHRRRTRRKQRRTVPAGPAPAAALIIVGTFRLGTRGSQLALWQANTVKRLVEAAGDVHCEVVIIKTSGDRLQEAPLSEVGGKPALQLYTGVLGVFTAPS